MARRFLEGLFPAGTQIEVPMQNPIPRVTQGNRSGHSTAPNSGPWDLQQAVRHGYERVIWVFRCVDAIASNGASIPMVVKKYDALDGEIYPDPDLNKLLNRRPNDYETSTQFRYKMISQSLLSRRGVFIEIVWGRDGRPKQLHLLANEAVTPVVNEDPTVFVSGYDVMTTDQGVVRLPPERVIWMRVKPHPTDPYAQMTPLVAAGLAADTDYLARVYNRNFLMNDGRPGMLITIGGGEAGLNSDDAQEIKRRFSGGARTAGTTTVVEADGLAVADLGSTPRDAQWMDAVQGSKEDILLAFGTPLSILGDSSSRCVDDQTEAFTQRGWVHGNDLTTDDTILSMDTTDGLMKWSPIHEVYRNPDYSGDMYRIKHAHADFLVTPGHNWAVHSLASDKSDNPFTLRKVEDLKAHDRIQTIGDAEQANAESTYSNAFVELAGWAVTEGHYIPNDQTRIHPRNVAPYVRIRQNVGSNADRIRMTLKEVGAKFSEHTSDDNRMLFNIRGEVAAALQFISPEKILSNQFILDLTAEQRNLLMHTMIDADGCRQDSTASWTFAQKNKQATEAFVFLTTLCGYTTSMREREYNYTHKGITQRMSDWIAIVRSRKVMTIQRDTRTVEQYEGLVWCPRTDYGTFVARRNGKVVLTGNTFDNADSEWENWWEITMLPLLDVTGAAFDILTVGGLDDEFLVAHDYTTIDVLQRKKRAREDRAISMWKDGIIPLDDVRQFLKMPKLNIPASRVLWLAPGQVPAGGNEGDVAAVQKLQAVGPPVPPDPSAAAQEGAVQGTAIGQRHFLNGEAARANNMRLGHKELDPAGADDSDFQ